MEWAIGIDPGVGHGLGHGIDYGVGHECRSCGRLTGWAMGVGPQGRPWGQTMWLALEVCHVVGWRVRAWGVGPEGSSWGRPWC